ncbi:MAG: protein TolQ [Alphaproteobacteria bacterium]|jgi:biopolymer transport protein TolQ|nr:protein TolQ [Alphaproteobacteria bacterium]MBP9876724.1 protein TolQ [Alphaproteobacteria bacterium]
METVDTAVSAIEGTALAGSVATRDLSIWGLISGADFVVQVVMFLLLIASIWCWAIIFDKWRLVRKLKRQADEFEHNFWSGMSLDRLYDSIGHKAVDPLAAIFSSGMREWRRSSDKKVSESEEVRFSLRERLERVMRLTISREITRIENSMGFLASIGSVAPFVGLFGTVWGIMNSLGGIAAAKQTSLAVVAPSMAEALLATALGLVAAIPAVLAYNKFSQDIARYVERLDNFSDEFLSIVSRHMEDQV